MYIAMNRFKIANGHIEGFVTMWKTRNSLLDQVDGFKAFKLLHGPADDTATLFVSHSVWESRAAFIGWTESEHFKKAHAGAKSPAGTHLEHPKFEGFEVVLEK
ncbi:MAG: antibiotic biosynthesis monooxygenase [Candidatus Omnitrophica bacterium]|nr:antibiotic biosynthesis monooxygenase [Candidatus Omnitrophota bacterium]